MNGNNYNDYTSECWTTPNMVAWLKQRLGATNDKMIIPWIRNNTGNTEMTYYFFYGSIVEGARGILWWQGDGTDNSDYSNQRAIRAGFTNNRVFRSTSPTYTGGKDEDFLLKGDLITAAYFTTNPDFIRTGSDLNCSRFGKVLEKKFSALVYKYSGNYRVFLVNHEHAANTTGSFDFLFATDDFADWTNAVDNNGNIISLDEHPGNPNWKILSTTLYSNDYYRIYEIEDAVQDL